MINSGERGFGLPKFSHAERERRWSRVRELMRQKQLDAIIGFPNQSHWDQFQADIRYLTHIGGHQTEVAVVFPLSGEVTAFVRGGNEVEWWSIAQDWLTDIRPSAALLGRARHRTDDGIAIAKRAHRCERFERSLARARRHRRDGHAR